MGGCIAQHIALRLLPASRLRSLYLAVTTRGNYFTLPISQWMWKFMVKNFILKDDPAAMVHSLVPKCFDAAFLAKRGDKSTGDSCGSKSIDSRTMQERWEDRWTREYPEWFSFADLDATAAQCSVFATHYLTDHELLPLVHCQPRVGVTVHIAEHDELMPPAKQRELGRILGAKLVVFSGGHMGGDAEKQRFFRCVLESFQSTSG